MEELGERRLWEREAAAAAIAHLLERVSSARGASLFIVGEGGLGKTSVLRLALGRAGMLMQTGIGQGQEMGLAQPYGLVSQPLAALGYRSLLERPRRAEAASRVKAAQFYGVLQWLRGVAGPTLVALDDIHWADPDSLALLGFVCRRLNSLPVGIIATMRPWPPEAAELAAGLAEAGDAQLERLAPLSNEASLALVAERCGRPVGIGLARHQHAATAGNPLLLEQLAMALDVDEEMDTAAAAGPRGLLLSRFAGLDDCGIRCAQAAAVLGGRFEVDLPARVAGLDAAEGAGAIDALWGAGLIRQAPDGRVEFVHPLFRQAVYDDLGEARRLTLHGRAFAVLLEHGLEHDAAEHALRGRLMANRDAATALQRTGSAALRAGALATAVEHLQASVNFEPVAPGHDQLMLLAGALVANGRVQEGIDAYRRLVRERPAATAQNRALALRALGRALSLTSEHEEAGRCFAEAITLAGPGGRRGSIEILLDHSLAVWLTAGPGGALQPAERARELAATLNDPVAWRRAEAVWGFIALQCGDPEGIEATRAAAASLVGDPLADPDDLSRMWGVLSLHSKATILSEDHRESEDVVHTIIRAAERLQAPETIVTTSAGHANTLVRLGRLTEALELLDGAGPLVELFPAMMSLVGVSRARIHQKLGNVTEGERWCDQVEPALRARGEWLGLLAVLDLRGERLLWAGDAVQGTACFLELEELCRRKGVREPCVSPWQRHAVLSHLAAGHIDDAERVVLEMEEWAGRLPCRWPRIVAVTGRALLAERDDQPEAAEQRFRQVLAIHDEVNLPLEKAETLLLYGRVLRRRGDVERARALLRSGLLITDQRSAGLLGRLIHEELLLAGGRRRRAGDGQLSPQERRVAMLAASGLTNRQIAQRMFLSIATIETHLRRIFGKLQIASRGELREVIGSGEPPEEASNPERDQGRA